MGRAAIFAVILFALASAGGCGVTSKCSPQSVATTVNGTASLNTSSVLVAVTRKAEYIDDYSCHLIRVAIRADRDGDAAAFKEAEYKLMNWSKWKASGGELPAEDNTENPHVTGMISAQSSVLGSVSNKYNLSKADVRELTEAKSATESRLSVALESNRPLYRAMIIASNAVDLIASSRIPGMTGGPAGLRVVLGRARAALDEALVNLLAGVDTGSINQPTASAIRRHLNAIDAVIELDLPRQ